LIPEPHLAATTSWRGLLAAAGAAVTAGCAGVRGSGTVRAVCAGSVAGGDDGVFTLTPDASTTRPDGRPLVVLTVPVRRSVLAAEGDDLVDRLATAGRSAPAGESSVTPSSSSPSRPAEPPDARPSTERAGGTAHLPDSTEQKGMSDHDVDDVDRAILYALQEDARNTSSDEIAERAGIAGSTVRKRIRRLESAGIIRGYGADVDYGKSGFPLRMLLFCTASIGERGDLVPEVLSIDGVVSVQELVTGEQNLLVTAVGRSDDDITPVAQELIDMGLTVADEVLVRSHETTPFAGFDPE
jgi:DNA-binding Lrp family transcriptional regulator